MIQKRPGRLLKSRKTGCMVSLLCNPLSRANFFVAVFVLGAGGVFCGCGKKETAPPAIPPTATSGSAQTAAAAPGAQVPAAPLPPVATAPQGGADLKDLNHAYISWVVQNHRHAKTFEEFATASGISIPPAPPGKKYVIDKAGFINVANQ